MSVKLIPEADLRAALRPHRVDERQFEAEIRERIKTVGVPRAGQDFDAQPSLLKVAAAFLPLPLIGGGKIAGGGAKLSSMALGQKLLGYAALPAISLFLLVGAAFFSASRIRSVQRGNHPDVGDELEMQTAIRQWWVRHKWVALAVFAAVLILPMIGSTSLLFLLLLVSFASLLGFLSGFAGLGVGNRRIIGQSCFMGLALLGQAMVNPFVGQRDIHFVDQKLIAVVLFAGTLILLPFVISGMKRMRISRQAFKFKQKASTWIGLLLTVVLANGLLAFSLLRRSGDDDSPVANGYGWVLLVIVGIVEVIVLYVLFVRCFRQAGASRFAAERPGIWGLLYVCVVAPLLTWLASPILWPATPARIQQHVESFDADRYPFIAWRDWEISASWTIEAGLDPDLSRARQRLADEITGEQDSLVLGSAFRVGLVRVDQIELLADLEEERRSLIPERGMRLIQPITSLNQHAWVIYALNQSGQLSPGDLDILEQRLLATFDDLADETADVIETALRVTQLLEVIDRPIDRDQYRQRVHGWLSDLHNRKPQRHQIAGGFEQYQDLSSSLPVTSHAIELMEIYGVPENLDLNSVRSYVRPLHYRPLDDKWIAAVSLNRLNRLPGVTQPTWSEWLYYERSLIAAMVLVAFCVYATASSPKLVIDASSNGDAVSNDLS